MIPIQFYTEGAQDAFAYVTWPMVPRVGDKVSIHPDRQIRVVKTVYWGVHLTDDDKPLLDKPSVSIVVEEIG